MSSRAAELAKRLTESVPRFVESLRVAEEPGRYLPCSKGATEGGRRAALGFSCFALKATYTLGHWERLDERERGSWTGFLASFQRERGLSGERRSIDAFVDLPVVESAARQVGLRERLAARVLGAGHSTALQRVLLAETKQAVATLVQVGASPDRPYRAIPHTGRELYRQLRGLDWTRPWAAGGQAAALAALSITQGPAVVSPARVEELRLACARFFEGLLDAATGAYFRGPTPGYSELVNGAMKILTGLDWLGEPVHRPEQLIDTCLSRLPSPEGCHLVDWLYVLHRCAAVTDHRRREIAEASDAALEMIERHCNPDGGLSYFIGRSQTHYYGLEIAQGMPESDIHGTCLLTWAAAMALDLLGVNGSGWRIIRP